MKPTFNANQLELARKVAEKFLPHVAAKDIHLDMNDTQNDTLVIGEYSVYAGSAKYVVEIFVSSPYRYNEPPDGDVVTVSTVDTFHGALADIVSHQTRDAVQNFIMDVVTPHGTNEESVFGALPLDWAQGNPDFQ